MKNLLMTGVAAIMLTTGLSAQTTQETSATTANGKIGKLSIARFNETNEKGNQMVAAIKPTEKPLSAADSKLFIQVAAGGKTQLLLSQAAVEKVNSPEAKLLAQSEVEEQTGVAAKLQEIASAKGITLEAEPLPETQPALEKMQGLSGSDLDAFYIKESGVNGHVKLQKTMTIVLSKAQDPALKKLAAATLPVIKMHLTVSSDLVRTKSGSNKGASAK